LSRKDVILTLLDALEGVMDLAEAAVDALDEAGALGFDEDKPVLRARALIKHYRREYPREWMKATQESTTD